MSSIVLGRVKSQRSGNTYEVKWDLNSHDIDVGGNYIGKASSSSEAMHKADVWAYNK